MGAPSKKVPSVSSNACLRTSSNQSSSTNSALVNTTKPPWTPKRDRISRCSTVWGITPSSAAMTSMARSMPPAPASIFLMNFSWPGTSTIPACVPSGQSSLANPGSMVMPRRFSSARRSVSVPVSALTRTVLP